MRDVARSWNGELLVDRASLTVPSKQRRARATVRCAIARSLGASPRCRTCRPGRSRPPDRCTIVQRGALHPVVDLWPNGAPGRVQHRLLRAAVEEAVDLRLHRRTNAGVGCGSHDGLTVARPTRTGDDRSRTRRAGTSSVAEAVAARGKSTGSRRPRRSAGGPSTVAARVDGEARVVAARVSATVRRGLTAKPHVGNRPRRVPIRRPRRRWSPVPCGAGPAPSTVWTAPVVPPPRLLVARADGCRCSPARRPRPAAARAVRAASRRPPAAQRGGDVAARPAHPGTP